MLEGIHDPKVHVFAVWEPVLASDLRAPSTATLRRLKDTRVVQFWDHDRLLSHAMGEHADDRHSIVWDYVAVYEPGKRWSEAPPSPTFSGRTVVSVIDKAEQALKKLSPAS